MRRHQTKKKLKLAVILLTLGLALYEQTSATATQERAARLFEIVGMETPLDQRFVDDGAAFVIHFAGDTHGNLDTCG